MKKISLLAFLLLSNLMMYGQVISQADFPTVEKIMAENIKYTTITSQFKQTAHFPILGENVVTEGLFYYNKPEQLAMRYTDPAGDMMLINEDRFTMVASGKKRETTAKANEKMQGMKNILSACLQGNVLQMGAEKVSCEETSKYYVITAAISKKNNKSNFAKVVVSYDKKDFSLAILQTIESDGSYTQYELSGKAFNKPIEEAVFKVTK